MLPGNFILRLGLCLCLALTHAPAAAPAGPQDTVTGAFEGTVTNSETGLAIGGAEVQIINQQTGIIIPKRSDSRGRFYQGLLLPGLYTIRVSAPGFQTREVVQRLFVTRTGEVVPVPVTLDPVTATPPPPTSPAPSPTPPAAAPLTEQDTDIRAKMNASDARRDGAFSEEEVSLLPLGGTGAARTFDELALLLPGVAPPPQTLGGVAGPGVGAGVGSSGQFSVNGLRSRANNFTVDGSDNNDEDIGVRRQGFVALVPQPVESVEEYQVITLLAPAQFGRNLGGQVNAVSKSGGSETHGTVYGLFNSSQLNARDFFDTDGGPAVSPLRTAAGQPVLFEGEPLTTRNESGGEDSFTSGQGGGVLGGPLKRDRAFYFVSAEVQRTRATREESFAVPTVEQRGAFGSGASGIFTNPFNGAPTATIPASRNGSAVFNLYPFPNDPGGVYGANTLTRVLPAGGRGAILSGKVDANFKLGGRLQSVTERYNFTDDWRDIPVTGGALFSTLRPRVRTQNSSFFFNSQVSAPDARVSVFNQVRLSYGRTRLRFEEVRDREFLIPSDTLPAVPFLLNAPLRLNTTEAAAPGVPNTGPVTYSRTDLPTVEEEIGPLGQVHIAGFSPLGVDVYNFPQRRVNNTYQLADQLTVRAGDHSLAFGTDNRRSELNSDLPRNSRPLVTFNGGPRLVFENGTFRPPAAGDPNPFIRPEDLVALGAATNFFLTLNSTGDDSAISLRYYQLNFFGQDTWRVRPDLSLSYGLRYEYNTPVRELNRRVENTFNDPALNLAPNLRQFIEGRARVYEPDRNNFAPRLGVAYSPDLFGRDRATVIRAGYGVFYDQIVGAVVSQSRNVYPTFLTLNFGGLNVSRNENFLTFFSPARFAVETENGDVRMVLPGTLNRLNPAFTLGRLIEFINRAFPSALGATLPTRRLETPLAHHYAVTFEQQLGANVTASAAFVGTQGRNLLGFNTPNLGPGVTLVPVRFNVFDEEFPIPEVLGRVVSPPRPVRGVGTISRFETAGVSSYHSLQLQLRGRLRRALLYQASYTLSEAVDDVSDVFDLAGAFVLPQNSLTREGERGPANFDVRHRFAYHFIYDLSLAGLDGGGGPLSPRGLLRGLKIAGTGRFRTGQPFTVNSVFDINLDGNLTDRLNNTGGLVETGDRRRPLRLATADTFSLLAPFGQDGAVGRNTFRAGSVIELDLSLIEDLRISSRQQLTVRADIFNVLDRANFGIPVRLLEAPGFGTATSTVTGGRRVQLSLKYSF